MMDSQVCQEPQDCLDHRIPYMHQKQSLTENLESQELLAQEGRRGHLAQEGRKVKEEIVHVKEESQDLA